LTIDFYFHQHRGMGNFIMSTPSIVAISKFFEAPVPVIFDTPYIKKIYSHSPYISSLEEPGNLTELFNSYERSHNHIPDSEFIFKTVNKRLGLNLEFEKTHIPIPKQYSLEGNYFVVAHGAFTDSKGFSYKEDLKMIDIDVWESILSLIPPRLFDDINRI